MRPSSRSRTYQETDCVNMRPVKKDAQVPSESTHSPEGTAIRELRLKLGITQEGLAHLAGVTSHTVWRLERNPVFKPRLDTFRAIAKALGVDVTDILNSSKHQRV